jgi:hypothetical protein
MGADLEGTANGWRCTFSPPRHASRLALLLKARARAGLVYFRAASSSSSRWTDEPGAIRPLSARAVCQRSSKLAISSARMAGLTWL